MPLAEAGGSSGFEKRGNEVPCYSPLRGYRAKESNPETGKFPIVFKPREGYVDLPIEVPCGHCEGCKLKKSREWAMRVMLESSLYEKNCFITLTYADAHLPPNGSIDPEAPPAFMKRLREYYGPGIRSFGCAEYGEKFRRPHYHICLFNHWFPDSTFFRMRRGFPVYRSERLEALWPFGHSEIGSLTFESAAYVARYVMKKVSGPAFEDHYEVPDMETGELVSIEPERSICVSRRPGVGRPWLEKFRTDIYPKDFVTIRGVEMRPPKYFDYRLEIDDPDLFAKVSESRKTMLRSWKKQATPERLRAMEMIQQSRVKLLRRGYEQD